jgi:DNA-binding HxlR family transcriptional regulator
VANATLSDRLKHLEANGLIERRRYQVRPERFEYVLTKKGPANRPCDDGARPDR